MAPGGVPLLGPGAGGGGGAGEAGGGANTVTFRVRATTSFGDSIVLVGGCGAMGQWEPVGGAAMTTSAEEYPVWSTAPLRCPTPTAGAPIEYKYVRLRSDGGATWEADGDNRRLPLALAQHQGQGMVIDDGVFGHVQPDSFGYPEGASPRCPGPVSFQGVSAQSPRLVVVGDAVAAGHRAWRFDGWAARLGQALRERYGYAYANLAEVGSTAHSLQKEFRERVAPLQPSVVVISLGSDLQQLATCPEWDRSNICKQFLTGLEALVEMAWEMGAMPVLGAPYPHAAFEEEQTVLLRQTHQSLKQWGVPTLDWLEALSAPGAAGTWAQGVSHDPAHPNTEGHRRMFQAVDVAVFEPARVHSKVAQAARELKSGETHSCFKDGAGFEVAYVAAKSQLVVTNRTPNEYSLNAGWAELSSSLGAARRESPWILKRGVYVSLLAEQAPEDNGAFLAVALDGTGSIATEVRIPGGCRATLQHMTALHRACSSSKRVLFYDGTLSIIRTEAGVMIVNEAECEYNVHPMWQDARLATRALSEGIYEDDSGCPFRTAVISAHGLQSRVKVPGRGAVQLERRGPLSSLQRVAVLPLGDRCSIRMLLHKIEFDGPCYPFDLTRTTSLADVADMIATGFTDMWNGDLLEYDHDAGRVFHKKWQGLSFAHEVEDGDDPVCNFGQVVARMAKRYTGRAARFDYAARNADSVLFLRTGTASREEVTNMLARVGERFPGLHASLLLISDQPSEEFQGLLGVTHVREHFDPDRMYEDMNYWLTSAHRFRGILEGHGINARSLYWCPNNLKEAEREVQEAKAAAAAREEAEEPPAPLLQSSVVTKFSHSNLYAIESCQGA